MDSGVFSSMTKDLCGRDASELVSLVLKPLMLSEEFRDRSPNLFNEILNKVQ